MKIFYLGLSVPRSCLVVIENVKDGNLIKSFMAISGSCGHSQAVIDLSEYAVFCVSIIHFVVLLHHHPLSIFPIKGEYFYVIWYSSCSLGWLQI